MRPENFTFLRGLLRQHAGVLLEEGKEYLVLARLGPLARRESWGSVDDLITHKLALSDINRGFDLMHAGASIRSVVVF